jgi:hypothetical protein
LLEGLQISVYFFAISRRPKDLKWLVVDVAALKSNPLLPGGFLVSGLVYDVATGRIELVVPPALLRPEKSRLNPE